MKKFNLDVCMKKHGGKCETKDGRGVRLLATDRRGGEYPLVGLVMGENGDEEVHSWTQDGKFNSDYEDLEMDLVLPSLKREIWVVLRGVNHEIYEICTSEEQAKRAAALIRGKKKIKRLEFDPEQA